MSKKLDEITGYKIAGLTMDLMSKLRDEVIDIKEFEKFLTMSKEERRKTFGTVNSKIRFLNSDVVINVITGKYNPKEKLTNNKVKYYFGDSFKTHILNPAKVVDGISEMKFSKHKFAETTYDKEIMENFGISEKSGLMTREEIIKVIDDLTSKQPKGEEGILINDGNCTIIGYLMCDDGVVRVAFVSWSSDDAEWHCYCDDLDIWSAGYEALSRN